MSTNPSQLPAKRRSPVDVIDARRAARPAPDPYSSIAIVVSTARALLRWWTVATPLGLITAAALAAGVWFTFERQYRAAAWIQIQENPTHLAYPTHDNPRRFVQNQIELLRSALVVGPALSDPEVAALRDLQAQDDAVSWLGKRLRVANVGESELFEVSFDSPDAAGAARLVNAVVDSYLGMRNEHDSMRDQRMLELLEEEKQLRAAEVTRLRENVRELSREILGKDPFTGTPSGEVVVLNHPLDRLLSNLTAAEVERKMTEVQLEAFNAAEESKGPAQLNSIVRGAVERHPEIVELKALLANKKTMLERTEEASKLGKQDPSYVRVEREVARLEQSLERTRKSLGPIVADELKAGAALKQGDEVARLEQSLIGKKAAEKLLREQYDAQLKAAGKTGSQSLELEFAKAELAREEKVFELIAQRALALRTETRAPARVALMKAATTPVVPLELYPIKKLLLAIAAGFCAPFALAVLWERWVKRIANAEQLDQQADVHVVGEVARLPLRTRRSLSHPLAQRDLSLFEESVDSLRTCLVLGEGDVRVIAVASAVSGEGKTSVAAQLAVSIARATGEPTLIIDADLRSPDVHAIFQIENEAGLAAILEGDASLAESVYTDWNELIHVLPAGSAKANPHTLINSARLREVLEEARTRYRHIVIDTPPILLASEALVIAKEADGTLLCTMRDHSRESQVKAAGDKLRAVGAHTLGAVLSGIPARQYTAKYGSYAYGSA